MHPITFPKLTLPDPGSRVAPTLRHRLVDDHLESVHARLRPNSTLALSAIRRRLSSLAGFYSHLVALGELDHNPVHRGIPVRSPVTRDRRVVRPVRHLPRVLDHEDAIKLVAALRKERDRAMIDVMLLDEPYRSSSTTTRPPSSWPPPSDSIRNDAWWSRCSPGPGCARPSSASSPTTPSSP